jgi:secreted trypsin-like serine protease
LRRVTAALVVLGVCLGGSTERLPLDHDVVGRPLNGVVALIASSAPETAPYQGYFCAAVVVASHRALTAAHCVVGRDPGSIRALVGADNLCRPAPIEGASVAVTAVSLHPQYDRGSGRFDLALLELSREMPDSWIWSVIEASPAGDVAALGWGSGGIGGAGSCRLHARELHLQSAEICASQLTGARAFDRTSMLCALPTNPGSDTCSGDSGGPLIRTGAPRAMSVVGVVSWSYGCGGQRAGVYARADAWRPGTWP